MLLTYNLIINVILQIEVILRNIGRKTITCTIFFASQVEKQGRCEFLTIDSNVKG